MPRVQSDGRSWTFRGGYNLCPRTTVSFRDVSWFFDFDMQGTSLLRVLDMETDGLCAF